MANLFQQGDFTLHSGERSGFKIECDALWLDDYAGLARLVSERFKFSEVYGVPRGGRLFAEALQGYCELDPDFPILIVDDVLTTGTSMEALRREMPISTPVIGVVVFARRECPDWIHPIFRMW